MHAFALGAALGRQHRGPFLFFARLALRPVLLELGTSPRFTPLARRPVLLQLKAPWQAPAAENGTGAASELLPNCC